MLGEGRVPYTHGGDHSVKDDVLYASPQLMSPDVSGWHPEDAGPEPTSPLGSRAASGERADGRLETASTSGYFGSQSILTFLYCRQVGALCQLEFAGSLYAMFNKKSEGLLQKHRLFCHECMLCLLRVSSYGISRKTNDPRDSGQLGFRFFWEGICCNKYTSAISLHMVGCSRYIHIWEKNFQGCLTCSIPSPEEGQQKIAGKWERNNN